MYTVAHSKCINFLCLHNNLRAGEDYKVQLRSQKCVKAIKSHNILGTNFHFIHWKVTTKSLKVSFYQNFTISGRPHILWFARLQILWDSTDSRSWTTSPPLPFSWINDLQTTDNESRKTVRGYLSLVLRLQNQV